MFIFFCLLCFDEQQHNSGVATLSITDSSATSSEDASNPDSPDNPSLNNDLLHHLNGSKCSKQNQQVPNNNNNSNHNKNKQVRNANQNYYLQCAIPSIALCIFFRSFYISLVLFSYIETSENSY